MALYIVYEGGETTWHVGQKADFSAKFINNVTHIQADGDELQYLYKQYGFDVSPTLNPKPVYSIPMPTNQRVIRWFGDIAKTILANL